MASLLSRAVRIAAEASRACCKSLSVCQRLQIEQQTPRCCIWMCALEPAHT
jgi:hypothetical protein